MTAIGSCELRIVSASARGAAHAESGAPNQDRHGNRRLADGAQVIAVADGAGSRSRSDRGAQLAVDGAIAAAERHFAAAPDADDVVAWRRAAEAWRHDCAREFDERLAQEIADGREPATPEARAAYATTLTAVVWRKPWLVVYAVGDCFLVIDHEPRSYLIWPTEFRENAGVTVFMTSATRETETYAKLIHDPGLRGLALCSDGLAESTLTVRPTADGFRYVAPPDFSAYFDVFAQLDDANRVLHQRISSQQVALTSGDDKTMVLAVRVP